MSRHVLYFCLSLLATPALAQESAPVVSASFLDQLPVVVKIVEPIHAVVLPMSGGYERHGAAIAQLTVALETHAVVPTGPVFGRYFSRASQGAAAVWQVGRPVPAGVQMPRPFEQVDLPAQEVASLVHQGAPEQAGGQWPLLVAWVIKNGYRIAGPATQIFFDDGGGAGSEAARTELQLPIEKAR